MTVPSPEAPSASPAKRVAVVGAGISGVTTTSHLLRYGIDVVLFERSNATGGVWHFDPRPSLEPRYPNDRPAPLEDELTKARWPEKDEVEVLCDEVEISVLHAPPGPCYKGLKTNIPTTIMRSTLLSWPGGTPEHFGHYDVENYIHELSSLTGVDSVIEYNTRVEEIVKRPGSAKWTLRTSTLHPVDRGYSLHQKEQLFDSVVVATGHYQEPYVPDIKGLDTWKSKFPERIMHSKCYRSPEQFQDQNVLLIGAAVSSWDIAHQLDGFASKIYRSSRGGLFDINESLLPAIAEPVGEVESFNVSGNVDLASLKEDQPIPGTAVLKDGRILSDIHSVIVATGYLMTYPFLTGMQSSTVSREEADDRIVITSEGGMAHNLHKDIFYIPDPSLCFVGVPFHCSTFSLFDFQGEVIARVFSGQAKLPSESKMRDEYQQRKETRGLGRNFHSLLHDEVPYMEEILSWVNEDAEKVGIRSMAGVDTNWHVSYKKFKSTAIDGLQKGDKEKLK
ncbi:hypothetical protein AJ80_05114 [Polytolypa hystricis UAMH7299]|uniref:FAD dependent oxidoreductase domain-containing protein n=1 Tax=Polytolypa hystricis (strain UAMH7299) TaxID=1447883 RepID=A0A2B7Y6S3_POLH7|nr:hypothetical protein AJ80_05114 [Polytolypa hystricis UAMH7299]